MNKYSLLSVIRRRKYCNYSRALHRYDNLLNRDFHADRPNQKWVTDISYIKTECIYRVKLKTYEEAHLLISQYIDFYNNQRIQLKTKLTPSEKRSQYVA